MVNFTPDFHGAARFLDADAEAIADEYRSKGHDIKILPLSDYLTIHGDLKVIHELIIMHNHFLRCKNDNNETVIVTVNNYLKPSNMLTLVDKTQFVSWCWRFRTHDKMYATDWRVADSIDDAVERAREFAIAGIRDSQMKEPYFLEACKQPTIKNHLEKKKRPK